MAYIYILSHIYLYVYAYTIVNGFINVYKLFLTIAYSILMVYKLLYPKLHYNWFCGWNIPGHFIYGHLPSFLQRLLHDKWWSILFAYWQFYIDIMGKWWTLTIVKCRGALHPHKPTLVPFLVVLSINVSSKEGFTIPRNGQPILGKTRHRAGHTRPGKHTKNYGTSPFLVGKSSKFLWPCSSSQTVRHFARGYLPKRQRSLSYCCCYLKRAWTWRWSTGPEMEIGSGIRDKSRSGIIVCQ